MMTDPTRPTPDEARRALDEASGIRVLSHRDRHVLPRVLLGVGAAMAVLLPLLKATGGHPWGMGLALLAYLVILALLLRWQRTVTAAPRGYGLRYGLGIAGASAMYGLGCAVIPQGASWSVTALFSLLTVLPALLGARAITRLGRAG